MRKCWLILALLTGVTLPLAGQVRSEGQTLLFQPEENRTRTQVGFRMREEDDACLPAEGKGLLQGEFRAHSRHSLDSIHRVEGHASYERGVKRAVNWNTSSDWDLLAPYITLDTVGGDLQKEQYRFAARFASRPGRFFYSLWADYRALHEYRNVDPRPRNITADLQVSAQGGLQMGAYALSLEAGYRRYHQSEDVEFMDPRGNNTSVLHYLGFGRYSTRFSGAKKNTAVRFNGNGFTARLVLEPVNGLGWIGGASYAWLQVARHLPGNNETPITQLLNQEFALWGGHKWSQAYLRADAQLRLRTGTENIVDQTSAFNVLAGLPMLQALSWKASVSGFSVVPLCAGGRYGQCRFPGRGVAVPCGRGGRRPPVRHQPPGLGSPASGQPVPGLLGPPVWPMVGPHGPRRPKGHGGPEGGQRLVFIRKAGGGVSACPQGGAPPLGCTDGHRIGILTPNIVL